MRNLIAVIVCFCIVFVASVCSEKGPVTQPNELKAEIEQEAEQDSLFAFDLLETTYNNESEPNIFISPFNISLSMSNGKICYETGNTLCISGFSFDEVNDYCKTLQKELLKIDPRARLRIGNSIWYDQNFPVKSDFQEISKLPIMGMKNPFYSKKESKFREL